jgi:hypothetical protein
MGSDTLIVSSIQLTKYPSDLRLYDSRNGLVTNAILITRDTALSQTRSIVQAFSNPKLKLSDVIGPPL